MRESGLSIAMVVPTLNERQFLPDLLAQFSKTGMPDELIIADGGSQDGTQLLATTANAQLIVSVPGRASQMNAGARAARSDILWFVHADSILPADCLTRVRCQVDKDVLWGRFDVKMSHSGKRYRLLAGLMNLRARMTGICTGDMGLFIQRRVFLEQGGFADIPLMEDVEISRRLRRLQWPGRISSPLVTSSRRWETQGFFSTVLLMWSLRLQYFFGVSTEVLVRRYYPGRARDDG